MSYVLVKEGKQREIEGKQNPLNTVEDDFPKSSSAVFYRGARFLFVYTYVLH